MRIGTLFLSILGLICSAWSQSLELVGTIHKYSFDRAGSSVDEGKATATILTDSERFQVRLDYHEASVDVGRKILVTSDNKSTYCAIIYSGSGVKHSSGTAYVPGKAPMEARATFSDGILPAGKRSEFQLIQNIVLAYHLANRAGKRRPMGELESDLLPECMLGFASVLKRKLRANSVAVGNGGIEIKVSFWGVVPSAPDVPLEPGPLCQILATLHVQATDRGLPTRFRIDTFSSIRQAEGHAGSRLVASRIFEGVVVGVNQQRLEDFSRVAAEPGVGSMVNDLRHGADQFGYRLAPTAPLAFRNTAAFVDKNQEARGIAARRVEQQAKGSVVLVVLCAVGIAFSMLLACGKIGNQKKYEYKD